MGLDLFLDDAQSSKQRWVRVDFPSRKPNWFELKTFRDCEKLSTRSFTIVSLTLHAMEVSETWRWLSLQSFLPFLWTRTMLAIFRAYGTSPAKKDLFRSERKVRAISIGGKWSGPGELCGLRFLRRRETLFVVQRIVDNLESTRLLYSGKFP